MIKILTLFLGLYSGLQTVELEVAESVASVELRLDGAPVGTLTQPPWVMRVDLGPALAPHELVAVARDAAGVELGRARRWANRKIELPEAGSATPYNSETAVLLKLDPGVRLPPVAEMQSWFSADGEPLEVLRVESTAAEVVIVRDPAVQAYLERTASFFFQLRLELQQDWDAVTLTNKEAFVATSRRVLLERGDEVNARRAALIWEQWRSAFSFGDDTSVRFISPRAAPVSRIASHGMIFNRTAELPSNKQGLLWHNALVRPLYFRPRVSDAVAMAGLEAHAGRRRRVVVLMMEGEAMGPSRYPPAVVRSYLEHLHVPLYVWKFGIAAEPTATCETLAPETLETLDGWGKVRDLTHPQLLSDEAIPDWLDRIAAAAEEVRKELRRQRVVWLRGSHLPHRITLSEPAAGGRLAGSLASVTAASVTAQGVH